MFSIKFVQNLASNFTEHLHHRKTYQLLSVQQPLCRLQQNFNNKTTCLFDQNTTIIGASHTKNRSSPPEVFCKKGVLRNFAKFTGKHLGQSLCNLIKKEILAQVFSCKFCKISKYTFFTEHLWVIASEYSD